MSFTIEDREDLNKAVATIINAYDNYVRNQGGSMRGLERFDVGFYNEAVSYKFEAEESNLWTE